MHAEAGRAVEFAEQPQGDFVETSHAPSDALVVVDRVNRYRACVGRQLVRDQTSGAAVVQQLAQTEIKSQSFLRCPEAGLVFLKHGSLLRTVKIEETARSVWATGLTQAPLASARTALLFERDAKFYPHQRDGGSNWLMLSAVPVSKSTE